MPSVLTTGSTVLCGPAAPSLHGGEIDISSTAVFTVGGDRVLTIDSVEGKPLKAPPDHCKTPNNNPPVPCSVVNSVTSPPSESHKLTVSGQPVLLDTLTGQTDQMGPLAAAPNQTVLTAL